MLSLIVLIVITAIVSKVITGCTDILLATACKAEKEKVK